MNADTIRQVVENIPEDFLGKCYSPPVVNMGEDRSLGLPTDPALGTFVHMYKNPAIGWHSAAIFAAHGMDFPATLSHGDKWVFKAYLYCLNPKTHQDKFLNEAIMIAHPEMRGVRDVIESLILCKDTDSPEKISKLTGMDARTIEAYEKLFFNVWDRRQDHMYIRNVVYPDSRLVEVFDGYSSNEDYGMILKRYGYNYGGQELFYLTGLPQHMLDEIPAAISSGKLEGVLMSQGYLMTKLGFGNQSQNTSVIHHARGLIAAAKQGGSEDKSEGPLSSVSERLVESFRVSATGQARQAIEMRKKLNTGVVNSKEAPVEV